VCEILFGLYCSAKGSKAVGIHLPAYFVSSIAAAPVLFGSSRPGHKVTSTANFVGILLPDADHFIFF